MPCKQVPISNSLYNFAKEQPTKQCLGSLLGCRKEVLDALWAGRPFKVSPIENEAMLCAMHTLRKLRKSRLDLLWMDSPTNAKTIQHADFVREIATFTAKNYDRLWQMGVRGRRRLQSWLPDQKMLYEYASFMKAKMVPYLKRLWRENPEQRELLFGGTGLDEIFSRKDKQ